jgi:hypothetical protein
MNHTEGSLASNPVIEIPRGVASDHDEQGRTHGMPFIFWLMEQRLSVLLLVPTAVAAIVAGLTDLSWPLVVAAWIAVPVCGIILPLLGLVVRSRLHDDVATDWSQFVRFRDEAESKRWAGRKIPMEILYEAYMAERLDFIEDVYEVMLRRNQLFRFCFTWGDVKFYFREFLGQNVTHTQKSDRGDIAHVYNRGNDFYNWFLGESMTYTSGMFHDTSETLEQAQERKLETVCRYVQMKPGDEHLDIGCGWGPLITHAASWLAQHGHHLGAGASGLGQRPRRQGWRSGSRARDRRRLPQFTRQKIRQDHLPRDGRACGYQELSEVSAAGAWHAERRRHLLSADRRPTSRLGV